MKSHENYTIKDKMLKRFIFLQLGNWIFCKFTQYWWYITTALWIGHNNAEHCVPSLSTHAKDTMKSIQEYMTATEHLLDKG